MGKRGFPRNYTREMEIIRLFNSGLTQEELGKKYNCTKQNISLIVRRYHLENNYENISFKIAKCNVCGYEEYEEVRVKALEEHRIEKLVYLIYSKNVCSDCLSNNIYRCHRRGCHKIGIKELFVSGSFKEHLHTALCKTCNSKGYLKYYHSHQEKYKEIYRRWLNRNRDYFKKRKEKGLCVYCGNPIDDGHSACSKCRKKIREKYALTKSKGICVKCKKNSVEPGLSTCRECREKRKNKNEFRGS